MTRLTRREFGQYPDYDCSDPTFHPAWLDAGRYWTFTPSVLNPRADKGSWICCYVTAGIGMICIMSDEVEFVEEVSS